MSETQRKSMGASLIGGVAIIALSLPGLGQADDDERMIPWDEAPEAVRDAIEEHMTAAVGQEIEVEVEDGVTVYESEIDVEGGEWSIEFNAEGEVLEEEFEADGDDDDDDDDDGDGHDHGDHDDDDDDEEDDDD